MSLSTINFLRLMRFSKSYGCFAAYTNFVQTSVLMKIPFSMKNQLARTLWLAISVICLAHTVAGQQIDLPRKSPKAGTYYQIGLTDMRIGFSSPAVGGRTIWGDVVPYGEVWRAGANEATTMEFSTEMNVEGQTLPAGKYAFFMIPRPGDLAWTVIFNKQADQWGAFRYDDEYDALRIDIKPTYNNGVQERLTYTIHDHEADKGYIKFAWDDVRLYIRFKVDVMGPAMENIITAIETAPEDKKWITYAQGANFLLENDQNIRQALQWADMSTTRRNSAWSWWIKAQLQAKSGDLTSAEASGQKAIDLGETAGNDVFYIRSKEEITSKVRKWRKDLGIDTEITDEH
jgi:hypothetical protein